MLKHIGGVSALRPRGTISRLKVDSDFNQGSIESENKVDLGCIDKNMQLLPKMVHSLVKKFSRCCMLMAHHDDDRGDIKAIISQLLNELEKVRVKMELIVLTYSDNNKSRKVCYLLD